MFKRQTSGAVVCRSCGLLVGVNDDRCYNCGVRNPGLWGFAPAVRRLGADMGFIPLLVGACIVLYVAALLMSRGGTSSGGPFGLLSPSRVSLFVLGASGAIPVAGYGRWWTVLSAGWLHANLLHLVFNLLWVRQLAPATADIYGAGRLVVIYTASSIAGFTLSTITGLYLAGIPLIGGAVTVGASAPIFGLLGALVYADRRGAGHHLSSQAMSYALILFVFGFISPAVDNMAHAGGFAGGWLAARLLDPLQPERLDHLVLALVCLLLSALAIGISVVDGVRLFMG
jgi:rhomboid protease GluP